MVVRSDMVVAGIVVFSLLTLKVSRSSTVYQSNSRTTHTHRHLLLRSGTLLPRKGGAGIHSIQ